MGAFWKFLLKFIANFLKVLGWPLADLLVSLELGSYAVLQILCWVLLVPTVIWWGGDTWRWLGQRASGGVKQH